MANNTFINITKPFNSTGGFISTASQVAVETGTSEIAAGVEETTMTKSLAAKLGEIDTALLSIDNTEVIELKVLEAVNAATQDLPSTASITAALQATSNFKDAAQGFRDESEEYWSRIAYGYYVDSQGNIVAVYKNGAYRELSGNTAVTSVETEENGLIVTQYYLGNTEVFFRKSINDFDELTSQVSNLSDIAEQLASSFDNESLIVICDSTYYNNLGNNKLQNTLYFCYISE